jgi:hypothetical protein
VKRGTRPSRRGLLTRIGDHLLPSYIAAAIVFSLPFVVLLFVYGIDLGTIFNPTVLALLALPSGVAQNFLSGVGLLATYALICRYVFRLASGFLRGRRDRVKHVKGLLLLVAVLFLGYALYKAAGGVLLPSSSLIGTVISLYGVWSLIVWVYVIPSIRGRYQPIEVQKGIPTKIRGSVSELRFSLWKGYQTRIKKDYGKVYEADHERLSDKLQRTKEQLSGLLLIAFACILALFPPLVGVAVVLWLRVFSVKAKPFGVAERILLLVVSVSVLAISTIMLLFGATSTLAEYFNLAYGIGILCGFGLLAYLLFKS